jgi:hypothetical protein
LDVQARQKLSVEILEFKVDLGTPAHHHTKNMGFLTQGQTLSWENMNKDILEYVKTHGVEQFIHNYNANKDLITPTFLFGDEVGPLHCEFLVTGVE